MSKLGIEDRMYFAVRTFHYDLCGRLDETRRSLYKEMFQSAESAYDIGYDEKDYALIMHGLESMEQIVDHLQKILD